MRSVNWRPEYPTAFCASVTSLKTYGHRPLLGDVIVLYQGLGGGLIYFQRNGLKALSDAEFPCSIRAALQPLVRQLPKRQILDNNCLSVPLW